MADLTVAFAENAYAFYDPDQPRDESGRWTDNGGSHGTDDRSKTGDPVGGGRAPVSGAASKSRPAADAAVQKIAAGYNAEHGLPAPEHPYVDVDQQRAGAIADAYEALPVHDDRPVVARAYKALADEVSAQWDYATSHGVKFEPWTKDGQPYQTSTEMAADVKANQHLWFYTGGTPNEFMAAKDASGLSINDKFRAVHDYFGHAAGGYGFGPRGEENAWIAHSQMFSRDARRALTTETRGQNSWVNFGRQNYTSSGDYKNIPATQRPYATQKTSLLPDIYAKMPGEVAFREIALAQKKKQVDIPAPAIDPQKMLLASATLSAQTASDKLVATAMAEALRLKRADWDDDEVADALMIHLGELSDADIGRIANMEVNEAFSLGRTAAAREQADNIEKAVYSAILDQNCCKTCEELDGEEFEVGSDEYNENMPPNANCEGGDQCRCAYIYVLAEKEDRGEDDSDTPDDEGPQSHAEVEAVALYDPDQPRDDIGRWTSGSGSTPDARLARSPLEQRAHDHANFLRLKNKWAQVNDDLKALVMEEGSPYSDAAKAKNSELKDIVKAMYRLKPDPGGIEGLGLPGGVRDMVIVGAGPGGLAAAIMGGTDGLDTLLVDASETPGGQAKGSTRVENYPGFPMGVTGRRLTQDMFDEAERVGAETKLGVRVTGITFDPKTELKTVHLSNGETVESRSVIIATGVEFKKLDFPGADAPDVVDDGDGMKLATMATGKHAVVLGGSNGAAQAALGAALKGTHVTLVSRSDITKGMSAYQVSALRNNKKITVIEHDEIAAAEVGPHGHLDTVRLKSGKSMTANVLGVFVGGAPNLSWLPKEIDRESNAIKVKSHTMETSMPGVYAVGDNTTAAAGRIGAAVGQGQQASKHVWDYFRTMPKGQR